MEGKDGSVAWLVGCVRGRKLLGGGHLDRSGRGRGLSTIV